MNRVNRDQPAKPVTYIMRLRYSHRKQIKNIYEA
jgi:hypothetical protein